MMMMMKWIVFLFCFFAVFDLLLCSSFVVVDGLI